MELEHAPDDHGQQRLLHLDPVTGDVTVEAILPVQHVHVRVPGAGALVESPGHVELFVQRVERLPVVRVPVVAVHEVGPDEGADGSELLDAPKQLPAGEVHVVDGQHGHELQSLGTVLAEVVDPVVIGLAEGEGEPGVQMVASDQAEAGGGEEDGDVHPFHGHAHHLGLGIVVTLDGEVEATRVGQARARERLGAIGCPRPAALAVLLQLGVHRGGQAVDDDHAAARTPVRRRRGG